jgi:hypothetical protein
MVETLYPGVYPTETALPPSVAGVSTSVFGIVATTKRGPVDELRRVDSFQNYRRVFGDPLTDSFADDAAFQYFQNGGRDLIIGRVVGTGALAATVDLPSLGGTASAPVIDSGLAGPYDLEPADAISIEVDGGAPQVFTFLATAATRVGGATALPPGAASTLILTIDNGTSQTIIFAGTETTAALVAQAINDQILGATALVIGGLTINIRSDSRGTGSEVDITGGTALVAIGHSVGTTTGTGNVANIDSVTTAEVVALLSTLVGAVASNFGGLVRITHSTPGSASTLEVISAPAAFSFPAGLVSGSDSTPVSIITLDARDLGADGNTIRVTTERWRASLTATLLTGATEAELSTVAKAEVGDVVFIDDGSTSVIVHVNAVDVAAKTIEFAAITLSSPIVIGAIANTASTHRARTTLSVAGLATDTVITVTSSNNIRVGTELSIDDDTNVLFRVVTLVNGNELTLNAALGFAFAVDTPIVTQEFDLLVNRGGTTEPHKFLSTQDTNLKDWVEVRLFGDGNSSDMIEATDLNPVIALDIEDRPAPVVNLLLAGGADGATPVDADYIGTAEPPTGLELFRNVNPGEVNLIAVPGITSLSVQQAILDMADSRTDMVGIVDPPLAMDLPEEVRDWRMNQLGRDTSYGILYYPWLTVRDRSSTNADAEKQIPPSATMAGVIARVTAESGVHQPPANVNLREVIQPFVDISDTQQGTLNPVGINVIRRFQGESSRIWGARTLSSVLDGREDIHVRRLLIFVRISLVPVMRRFLFQLIQPALFRDVRNTVRSFLKTVWSSGGLFPSTDFESSQFVKCDSENNPPETQRLKQLFVDVGIRPPAMIEAIVLNVALSDGVTVVES